MPGQLQWDSTGFPVISQSRDMKRNSDRSYRRWLGTRYLDKTVSASRQDDGLACERSSSDDTRVGLKAKPRGSAMTRSAYRHSRL